MYSHQHLRSFIGLHKEARMTFNLACILSNYLLGSMYEEIKATTYDTVICKNKKWMMYGGDQWIGM